MIQQSKHCSYYDLIVMQNENKNVNKNENERLINRQFHECVYDYQNQQMIIFGGYGCTSFMFSNLKNKNMNIENRKLPKCRLNDILIIAITEEKEKYNWRMIYNSGCVNIANNIKCWPHSRMHHSCAIIYHNRKPFMFLFGGRSNPCCSFNDIWLFNIQTREWISLQFKTENNDHIPCGRYRQSLTVISDNELLLFGGCTCTCIHSRINTVNNKHQQLLLNDMFIFRIDFESFSVHSTVIQYSTTFTANNSNCFPIPCPRASMSVHCIQMNHESQIQSKLPKKIIVFGGLLSMKSFELNEDSNVYIMDLCTFQWEILKIIGNGPLSLYGHCSLCYIQQQLNSYSNSIYFVGGIICNHGQLSSGLQLEYNNCIWELEISNENRRWRCYKLHFMSATDVQLLSTHDMNLGCKIISLSQENIVIVGGGVSVFSFGAVYNKHLLKIALKRISL